MDFLWERGYTQIYVVPPSVTHSCLGRYRQSGAHTDPSDARLLADLLRTDRHRFAPWRPDAPLTRQMRALVSRCLFLTRSNVRLVNRLRAVLLRYYPAAVDLFASLDGVVTWSSCGRSPRRRQPPAWGGRSSSLSPVSTTTPGRGTCARCLPVSKNPALKRHRRW